MKATQLPVFRKMYDLNLTLIRLINKFPKQYKYNIGDKLLNTSLELFKHLFTINRVYNDKQKRVDCIDTFLNEFDMLKVLIRLSNEERLFSIKDSANLALITEDITRQINGWRKKLSSDEKEQKEKITNEI